MPGTTVDLLMQNFLIREFGEGKFFTSVGYNISMQVSCQRRDELEGVTTGIYWLQQEAEWRGYDGALGRFTQPDSIVPTGTQGTQAWDRYAFVNNNPVRYNDPTGHMIEEDENNSEQEKDPPPPLEELCGSNSNIGCSLDGSTMLLWLDGQYITIDVNSLTNEQLLHVTDFALASSNYEASLTDLPWDIGIAIGGAVAAVLIAGEMILTSPSDIVPVLGQIKFGLEVGGLVVTGAIALFGIVKTGIDAYNVFTIPGDQAGNFEYLQSIAIMTYP